MGMFDYVAFVATCVRCKRDMTSWQTKDTDCNMELIPLESCETCYTYCDYCYYNRNEMVFYETHGRTALGVLIEFEVEKRYPGSGGARYYKRIKNGKIKRLIRLPSSSG